MTAPQTKVPAPQWDDALLLHAAPIDDDHKEIVAELGAVVLAVDTELLARWSGFIGTLQRHFDREDRWMQMTGFTADNCHSSQHAIILGILRDGEVRGQAGELDVVRQMATEMGQWLPHHVEAMDAALVSHFQAVGFDVTTDRFTLGPLQLQGIQSCGGDFCGDSAPTSDPSKAVARNEYV